MSCRGGVIEFQNPQKKKKKFFFLIPKCTILKNKMQTHTRMYNVCTHLYTHFI